MIDRRFPTALQMMHTLVHAAVLGDSSYMSSAQFARYLGANPTLVRKLLTMLVQAGLLRSQMGRSGGVQLAKSAEDITLRDIYMAVVADKKLWTVRPDLPQICYISTNFPRYFDRLVRDADEAVADVLQHRTLAQSYHTLHAMARRKPAYDRRADNVGVIEGGTTPTA